MATKEDRSLPSGMSIPQWMKTKMNDRLDFEKSAFSPTELDDSFMFYYKNNKSRAGSEPPFNQTTDNSLIENKKPAYSSSADTHGVKPDFSKHTLYCQKFLQNSDDANSAQQVKFPSATRTKPSGVDDGFKGEAAKCGSSVIRMAHQMVAGKVIRGFNLETRTDCDGPPEGFNPSLRRGSRSLPASPLNSPASSPKMSRKVNKYFTGAFVDNESHNGSWLLSNLLSKRKTLSQSVGYIAEEGGNLGQQEQQQRNASQGLSVDDLTDLKKKTQVFVAKPSELREMNFWSPTSM